MTNTDSAGQGSRSQRHRDARDEWRRLCDTIEQAQGDELARACRDRFQFVRTYKVYGSKYGALVNRLRRAVESGDVRFFQERGVPSDLVDWRFAEQLLQDWNDKVLDKKRRLASIYQMQFGEPLERAASTDEEAFRMESVEPLHECDALLQLSGMSDPGSNSSELDELRGDIRKVQEELQSLSNYVRAELDKIKKGPSAS